MYTTYHFHSQIHLLTIKPTSIFIVKGLSFTIKHSIYKVVMNQPDEKKNWLDSVFLTTARTNKKQIISAFIGITIILSFSQNTLNIQNSKARKLSIYLGNGNCEWTPPTYDVPDNINFTKTLIAGFPSGDKRLTFVQMEALTGLSARDEWDFAYLVSEIADL